MKNVTVYLLLIMTGSWHLMLNMVVTSQAMKGPIGLKNCLTQDNRRLLLRKLSGKIEAEISLGFIGNNYSKFKKVTDRQFEVCLRLNR